MKKNNSSNANLSLYGIIKTLDAFLTRISRHHTFLLAAGIAFNIALYIIPLFLLTIYLVNELFGIDYLAQSLERILFRVVPTDNSARSLIHDLILEINIISNNSAIAGWIGIFILIWISSTLLNSIRVSLNLIFGIKASPIYLINKIKDLFLALALAVLIISVSLILPAANFLIKNFTNLLPEILKLYFTGFIPFATTLFITFLFFYFIFSFIPNKKLPQQLKLISTVLSVISIELSKNIFGWYLATVSNYGKFYGAYAVIVSLAVWIYYFSLITLLSAEISQFIYDLKDQKSK